MKMTEMCCYNKKSYELIGLHFLKHLFHKNMYTLYYACVHDKSNNDINLLKRHYQ